MFHIPTQTFAGDDANMTAATPARIPSARHSERMYLFSATSSFYTIHSACKGRGGLNGRYGISAGLSFAIATPRLKGTSLHGMRRDMEVCSKPRSQLGKHFVGLRRISDLGLALCIVCNRLLGYAESRRLKAYLVVIDARLG